MKATARLNFEGSHVALVNTVANTEYQFLSCDWILSSSLFFVYFWNFDIF